MRNVLQRQITRTRAEPADGQHHDQHAADDERQYAGRAEVVEEQSDQQAAEHRRQATERIAETHRPGADVGGEQFALVRVITETQSGVAEGDDHPS